MKRFFFFLSVTAIFFIFPLNVFAQEDAIDLSPILSEVLSETDISEWEGFAKTDCFGKLTNAQTLKDFISDVMSGNTALSLDCFLSYLLSDFIGELKSHILSAGTIFAVSVLASVITKVAEGRIAQLAHFVLTSVTVLLTVSGFGEILYHAKESFSQFSGFTKLSLPVLVSFSAVTDGAKSTLNSDLLIMTEAVSLLIGKVIIPLTLIAYILKISELMTSHKLYGSLSSTTNSFSSWLTGIMFSLFFGITAVQKLTSSALQGATAKAVKYTVSSFSLYGGTFLSKSVDIVSACSVILRSILGSAGMIIIISISASPAVRLLAASLVYRILSVFVAATGEEKITSFLEATGKVYGALFLFIMTGAVLFIIFISASASAGGVLFGI